LRGVTRGVSAQQNEEGQDIKSAQQRGNELLGEMRDFEVRKARKIVVELEGVGEMFGEEKRKGTRESWRGEIWRAEVGV